MALAATGFDDSQFATDLALAAEYQVRFRKAGILRRGAVDSFFGNLVIEFEYDLRKTRDHALEQLQNYVAGAWTEDSSAARPYLAVASDGRRWEVFATGIRDRSLPITAENVVLEPTESWESGGKDDSDSLRQFLNRLFFRKTLLKPTAPNFARDFGLGSPAFLRARTELTKKLSELSSDSQLQVFRKAWSDSLQISYGSVETDDQLFAKHTYLAVLARLLVWSSSADASGDRWRRQNSTTLSVGSIFRVGRSPILSRTTFSTGTRSRARRRSPRRGLPSPGIWPATTLLSLPRTS